MQKQKSTVDQAMKDWQKLTEKEKDIVYSSWMIATGEDWDKDYSQLKVDELFDTLGGTELPRRLLSKRHKHSKRKR